jgi:HD superfamily phosphodiesterase
MNLPRNIESAEHKFKQILEDFFISVYDEKSPPSHGIDHHRRVWSYAKELLTLYIHQNPSIPPLPPSKLIIACYLHDIGMSVETGTNHGKLSRDLCVQFLQIHKLLVNDYQDVLNAIENHDNKDYTGNSKVNDLLLILSVADDLDAFGLIGIYRYSEIYLTRGATSMEIGDKILENAGKRFDNFLKSFGFADSMVHKHRKRYDILKNFFIEYNKQIKTCKFESVQPSGYCGVMKLLTDIVCKKRILEDICRGPENYSNDPVIQWFFDELKSEIF